MGKGDPRGKKKKPPLPKLAPVPGKRKRDPSGRYVGEDPRNVAFAARCRHAGIKPDEQGLRDAASVDHWHPALRIIKVAGGRDTDRLRDTFEAFDRSQDRFYRLVLNMSRFPNVAKLEFLPETFEARADDVVDHRTPEEKVASAKKAYGYWLKRYERLQDHERILIDQGLQRYEGYMRDGKPTTIGMAFIAALRVLGEV
jgi:hypothetical protein